MLVRPQKQKGRYGFTIEALFNFPTFVYPAIELEISGRHFTWMPDEPGYAPEEARSWYWYVQDFEVTVHWEARQHVLLLSLQVKNLSDLPITLYAIEPARISVDPVLMAKPDQLSIFQNGYQSWSPTRFRKATDTMKYPLLKSFGEMNHYTDSRFWKRRDGLLSAQFILLKENSALESGLFGFLTQKTGLGEIFWRPSQRDQFICSLDYGGKELLPGESLRTDPLYLTQHDWPEILHTYLDEVGNAMEARIPEKAMVGWSSWYEYYTKISPAELSLNAERISQFPELGATCFQIDDGYQQAVGDWLQPAKGFPPTMAELAQGIGDKGLKPGIWLAPFMATTRSELFRDHPGWFLRNERGKFVDCGYNPNWGGRTRALDLTHPEALAWLYNLFVAFRAVGFVFFKLDFLFAGLRKGHRFDPQQSPLEAYRDAMATIRRAVGEESYILGCGAPLGASIGHVDSMRISADTKEVWEPKLFRVLGRGCDIPSMKDNLRNNLTRMAMNGRWWLNDPDCLIVREKHSTLTPAEIQLQLTIAGLGGGAIFLGDALHRLSPQRLRLLDAVLPPSELTATPIFPEDEAFAEQLLLLTHTHKLEARFNWTKRRQHIEFHNPLDRESGYVFDFWRGEMISTNHDITIPPHGVRVLIHPLDAIGSAPRIVGTTFHLTGLLEGRLRSDFHPRQGRLILRGERLAAFDGKICLEFPPNLLLEEERLPREVLHIEKWPRGYVLTVEAKAPWTVTLDVKEKV
ncbi:MAG: alpha-galactosidase [Lentisphaeria bacterium]|nr:alpha-galactosidase [Candidatus Neomarinimicrobiota bacterium]MCF7842809.1 alpha-galactosidase [Lentisphaeria bacterium]